MPHRGRLYRPSQWSVQSIIRYRVSRASPAPICSDSFMFTPNGVAWNRWLDCRGLPGQGVCSSGRQLSILAEVIVMGVCYHDGMAVCAGGPCPYRQNGVSARPRHVTRSPRSGALIGLPTDQGPPSPLLFMEFGVTSAMCLLAAFLVSLVSERKTGQVRAAMMRMCAPRTDREARDRG
jgi:hypothetical protein